MKKMLFAKSFNESQKKYFNSEGIVTIEVPYLTSEEDWEYIEIKEEETKIIQEE